MSTETEALREQFEAWARKNELEAERHKYADDQYDDRAATSAWWACVTPSKPATLPPRLRLPLR